VGRSEVLKLVAKAIRQVIAESEDPTNEHTASPIYRASYLAASFGRLADSCDECDVDMIERFGRPAVKVAPPKVTP
jgi:hypothetical protein